MDDYTLNLIVHELGNFYYAITAPFLAKLPDTDRQIALLWSQKILSTKDYSSLMKYLTFLMYMIIQGNLVSPFDVDPSISTLPNIPKNYNENMLLEYVIYEINRKNKLNVTSVLSSDEKAFLAIQPVPNRGTRVYLASSKESYSVWHQPVTEDVIIPRTINKTSAELINIGLDMLTDKFKEESENSVIPQYKTLITEDTHFLASDNLRNSSPNRTGPTKERVIEESDNSVQNKLERWFFSSYYDNYRHFIAENLRSGNVSVDTLRRGVNKFIRSTYDDPDEIPQYLRDSLDENEIINNRIEHLQKRFENVLTNEFGIEKEADAYFIASAVGINEQNMNKARLIIKCAEEGLIDPIIKKNYHNIFLKPARLLNMIDELASVCDLLLRKQNRTLSSHQDELDFINHVHLYQNEKSPTEEIPSISQPTEKEMHYCNNNAKLNLHLHLQNKKPQKLPISSITTTHHRKLNPDKRSHDEKLLNKKLVSSNSLNAEYSYRDDKLSLNTNSSLQHEKPRTKKESLFNSFIVPCSHQNKLNFRRDKFSNKNSTNKTRKKLFETLSMTKSEITNKNFENQSEISYISQQSTTLPKTERPAQNLLQKTESEMYNFNIEDEEPPDHFYDSNGTVSYDPHQTSPTNFNSINKDDFRKDICYQFY